MSTNIGFKNLSKSQRNAVIGTLSGDLSNIAINRKLEQLEPLKSSIEIVPTYISVATAAITRQMGTNIANGAITTQKIANNAITSIKLAKLKYLNMIVWTVITANRTIGNEAAGKYSINSNNKLVKKVDGQNSLVISGYFLIISDVLIYNNKAVSIIKGNITIEFGPKSANFILTDGGVKYYNSTNSSWT